MSENYSAILRKPWTFQLNWQSISIASILSLLLVSVVFNKNAYINSQRELFILLNNMSQTLPDGFWNNVTQMGDALVLIPFMSIICVLNTRFFAAMFGAIPLSSILTHLGKNVFSIPRPAAIIDSEKITIIGEVLKSSTSFPSGHTITIFTAASSIYFVLIRSQYLRSDMKLAFTLILFVFASLIAISRVAVGAHWPGDIVFGAVIGVISGASGEYLSRRYLSWWNWINTHKRYLGYLILGFSLLLTLSFVFGKVPGALTVCVAILISSIVGSYFSLRALIKT